MRSQRIGNHGGDSRCSSALAELGIRGEKTQLASACWPWGWRSSLRIRTCDARARSVWISSRSAAFSTDRLVREAKWKLTVGIFDHCHGDHRPNRHCHRVMRCGFLVERATHPARRCRNGSRIGPTWRPRLDVNGCWHMPTCENGNDRQADRCDARNYDNDTPRKKRFG